VLIEAESGHRERLVARLIHRLSPRGIVRLVALNCAAFPRPCSKANCLATPGAPLPELRPAWPF